MTTEPRDDDSGKIRSRLEDIAGARAICVAVIVIGAMWSIVVGIAGWGFATWAVGAVVWCFLLLRAIQFLQSMRCPKCGRRWRELNGVGTSSSLRSNLPSRCSSCGTGLDV